mmetsp:Transcript_10799/g.22465  ORF Transcript_10799/g.22465 Transcript_10799/m.22465 type:complete len:280 (+) Transcript_10799:63-902(+)
MRAPVAPVRRQLRIIEVHGNDPLGVRRGRLISLVKGPQQLCMQIDLVAGRHRSNTLMKMIHVRAHGGHAHAANINKGHDFGLLLIVNVGRLEVPMLFIAIAVMKLGQAMTNLFQSTIQLLHLIRVELCSYELAKPLSRALFHGDDVADLAFWACAAEDLHRESDQWIIGYLWMVLEDPHKVLGFRQNVAGDALAPALFEHQLLAVVRNNPNALVETSFEASHLLDLRRLCKAQLLQQLLSNGAQAGLEAISAANLPTESSDHLGDYRVGCLGCCTNSRR